MTCRRAKCGLILAPEPPPSRGVECGQWDLSMLKLAGRSGGSFSSGCRLLLELLIVTAVPEKLEYPEAVDVL